MNTMTSQIAWGEPVILEGQSIVLGKIKAEVPVQDKGLEEAKILMQNYFQQVNALFTRR